MPIANLTNMTISNSTLDILRYVNTDLTGGTFVIWLIVALFVVIIINMSFYGQKDAFLVASFITTIISWYLWLAQLTTNILVPVVATVMLIVMIIITIIWPG